VALVQRGCYLGRPCTANTSKGIDFGGILPYYVCEGIHISSAVLSDLCVLSPHMCTSSS
jgi:hypothetical protein